MRSFSIPSVGDLPAAAAEFARGMNGFSVFAFYAPMGTGKTTLIKAVCRELGIRDVINSPTFAIVNEYCLPGDNRTLYHMDCYRLKNIEEAMAIGITDYFDSGNICLIEWPEVLAPLLPAEVVRVNMHETSDGCRHLEIIYPNDRSPGLLP